MNPVHNASTEAENQRQKQEIDRLKEQIRKNNLPETTNVATVKTVGDNKKDLLMRQYH
jgi:hypothetical protein